VISSAPAYAPNDGIIDAATAALGTSLTDAVDLVGEVTLTVARDELVNVMTTLRDDLHYQQLMEIAGVDYPERELRFEVVYHLLSLTKNHRIRVKVLTDDTQAVPSVTGLWPVAGWLEREVFDMYGVLFSGNSDLRRILTDYGFRGHPQRKDFPLTGYVELRYSEEAKRVVYEPVKLAQDFRTFDFLSPWEGAEYSLPGDEKAAMPEAKGAPTPLKADEIRKADAVVPTPPPGTPKTTDAPAQTGAGAKADAAAVPRPSAQANPPEPANVPPPEAVKPKRVRKPKGEA
jgi:NADH-quinone oxidoreductase subunit C